jgi:hypothetical protein
MERKQQSTETVVIEKSQEQPKEERTPRRSRLQIDVLETRIAPSAIWGD